MRSRIGASIGRYGRRRRPSAGVLSGTGFTASSTQPAAIYNSYGSATYTFTGVEA